MKNILNFYVKHKRLITLIALVIIMLIMTGCGAPSGSC